LGSAGPQQPERQQPAGGHFEHGSAAGIEMPVQLPFAVMRLSGYPEKTKKNGVTP
jgi:hypothetical protein